MKFKVYDAYKEQVVENFKIKRTHWIARIFLAAYISEEHNNVG